MAKRGFIGGILSALIVCAVSFLIIFFLFPQISERYFGISFKNGDVSKAVTDTTSDVREVIDNISEELKQKGASKEEIDQVVGKIKDSDVWEKIKDTSVDAGSAIVDAVKEATKGINIDISVDSIKNTLSKIDIGKFVKNLGNMTGDTLEALLKKIR